MKRMAALALLMSVLLCGCNVQFGGSVLSTSPTRWASFNGVELKAPSDWSIYHVYRGEACPPLNSMAVVIGDFSGNGNCAIWSTLPSPQVIFVASEAPNLALPATLTTLGSLRGWQTDRTNQQPPEWVAVLPRQHVQITFVGALGTLRQKVLNTIRTVRAS